MLSGVDISQWQGNVNHKLLARAVDFAIVRTGDGIDFVDPKHYVNSDQLRREGVLIGHYHYFRPNQGPPAIQARIFLDEVGWLFDGEIMALDLEEDGANLIQEATHAAIIVRNVAGRAPVIYTNPDFLTRYDFQPLYELGCPLWVASWGVDNTTFPAHRPWSASILHQFASDAQVDGIAGDVDVDTFIGDADAWRNLGAVRQRG